MEWFIIFQSLAKLSQWIVKTDFWCSHSKILGLTFPHNKYWISLFRPGSDRKGVGWGIVRGQTSVCKGGPPDLLLGGLTLFPHYTQSPFPLFLSSLYLSPFSAFLLLSPPLHTPFSLPLPAPITADRLGQTPSWLENKRRGRWKPLQGLSLKLWWWKDSMNLNNFSQENSGLCLLKNKTFRNL